MKSPGLVIALPSDKPRNNYAQAWLTWEEWGAWTKQTYAVVPLAEIDIPSPWSNAKLRDNVEWIHRTGKTRPVQLYKGKGGKYTISDGIHRCNAARELGYDAVPAVISIEMDAPPPPAQGVEKLRGEQAGWSLYQAIKREYQGPVDWGNVKEKGDNFVLVIEREDNDKDLHWEIQYTFDKGVYNAEVSGSSFGRTSGKLNEVAPELASIMAITKSNKVSSWIRKGLVVPPQKNSL
jgi:hypothetical protein